MNQDEQLFSSDYHAVLSTMDAMDVTDVYSGPSSRDGSPATRNPRTELSALLESSASSSVYFVDSRPLPDHDHRPSRGLDFAAEQPSPLAPSSSSLVGSSTSTVRPATGVRERFLPVRPARGSRNKYGKYGIPKEPKKKKMPFRQRLARHLGETLSPESKILSYYDVNLTYEDMRALRSDWLTDNNICFWEEYLEHEVLPKYPQARIAMLRPSLTLLLMNADRDVLRTQLPSFKGITHVFLPITDAKDFDKAEGGTHWSLLLVSTIDGVAFHYDSLGGVNTPHAERATKSLAGLLGRSLRFQDIDDCPIQENGNDCGVFVCILMRHLLVKRLLNANAREKVSMSMANKMIDANGGRKEMLKIIDNLRREGERIRSTSPFAKSESKEPPRIGD